MWHVILGDSSASSTQLFRGSMQSIQAFSAAAEAGTSNAVVSGNRPGQTFIADYTVRAIADVVYFRVTRSLYQASHSATLLERAQRDNVT